MNAWEEGQFDMLVQDTERTMEDFLSSKQGGLTTVQRAKIFQQKMLRATLVCG